MADSKQTPLNVLFITHAYPDYPDSFRGRLVYRMARGLRMRGVEVHVLTPRVFRQSPLEEVDDLGVRIHRFAYPSGNRILLTYNSIPVFRMLLFFLSAFFKGWTLLRKRRFHLIHAHWLVPLGPLAVALGKLFRLPVIAQAHGSDVHTYGGKNSLLRRLMCFTVRNSDRVLTVSRELEEQLYDFCGMDEDRHIYFPTFIDGCQFTPPEASGAPADLVYVGGFFENKGILTLLKAAEQFLPMKPELNLTILGDGPLREHAEEWIRDRGFERRVSMPGIAPYDRMPEYLRSALALILPSYHEGLPSAILEALACGTPCIASGVGEIPRIVRDEVNGFLIAPGSFEQIAASVLRLATDPALSARLRANAREGCETYLAEAAMERLALVYKAVLKNPLI